MQLDHRHGFGIGAALLLFIEGFEQPDETRTEEPNEELHQAVFSTGSAGSVCLVTLCAATAATPPSSIATSGAMAPV